MIVRAREVSSFVAVSIRSLLGDGAETEPAARRDLAVGGVVPEVVARPSDQEELRACVECVAARGAALVALGLGAHRDLGHPPRRYDVALSTTRLARTIEYTPADMTITVEAGLTVAALQEALAAERQWLPLDPPLPGSTTVGGLIAADLSGPLRASQGRVRDFLIGISVVTADGRAARAGGRVVKNVAGYDLMKLFAGSLGTLAIVTEATFKVRPLPAATRCLALACQGMPASLTLAERLAETNIAALAATLMWDLGDAAGTPVLVCLLGGVDAEIGAECERLLALAGETGAEVVLDAAGEEPDASGLSAERRDFIRSASGNLVVRMTALPRRASRLAAAVAAEFADTPGRCLLDPRTGSVAVALELPDAEAAIGRLAALASTNGARLVVERWPAALAASIEVWWPLPAALPLMRRMKSALDPGGALAPGRFVGRI